MDLEDRVTVKVLGKEYILEKEILCLDNLNLSILNEQISRIAGEFAFIGSLLSKAVRELDEAEIRYKGWRATQLSLFSDLKSEKAKETAIINMASGVVSKHECHIADLKYNCEMLRVYKQGIEIKYQLSQTLSANLRAEREKYK